MSFLLADGIEVALSWGMNTIPKPPRIPLDLFQGGYVAPDGSVVYDPTQADYYCPAGPEADTWAPPKNEAALDNAT